METLNAMLYRLYFLLMPEKPHTTEQLKDLSIKFPLQVLNWISDLAVGKGLASVFLPDSDHPVEPRESIVMLQQLLQRSGAQAMNEVEGDAQTPVCGFSYVTVPDEQHCRDIAFCGYFPADNPKYSIIVWLRQENLPDELKGEYKPELGDCAASVCKQLVDYMMSI